jgi:hypothetical protein
MATMPRRQGLYSFGTFFPALVSRTKKNLATLNYSKGAAEGETKKKFRPGLPDFSWYKIPKREKYAKLPRTIPNVHKI